MEFNPNPRWNYVVHVVAKFEACATDNTDPIMVIVRELPFEEKFTVHVVGGLISTGEDQLEFTDLFSALVRAAEEVRCALSGE